MKTHFALFITLLLPLFLRAQMPEKQWPAPIRVYLDRFNPPHDAFYLKSVVRFVDYTDKQANADLHVQTTIEQVGNGDYRYGLYFFGKGRFSGQNDTIFCLFPPAFTSATFQEREAELFKQGLLPYLLQTEWAEKIVYRSDTAQFFGRQDWHRTTFLLGASGRLAGSRELATQSDRAEPNRKRRAFSYSYAQLFSVTHVGDWWRYWGNLNLVANASQATLLNMGTENTENLITQTLQSNTWASRRLTERFFAGAGASTFLYRRKLNDNDWIKYRSINLSTGFEYNFYPFSQYFRRYWLSGYRLGYFDSNQYANSPAPTPFSHSIYTTNAGLTRWGFYTSSVTYSTRFSNSNWHVYYLTCNAKLGVHLGKNVFLTTEIQGDQTNEISISHFGGQQGLFSNKALGRRLEGKIGFLWVLGSGLRNVLSPVLIGF